MAVLVVLLDSSVFLEQGRGKDLAFLRTSKQKVFLSDSDQKKTRTNAFKENQVEAAAAAAAQRHCRRMGRRLTLQIIRFDVSLRLAEKSDWRNTTTPALQFSPDIGCTQIL